jgi:hypothetical protein
MLAACKTAPPPAQPVENRASSETASDLGPKCTVQGRVIDAANGEGQTGATLVAHGKAGDESVEVSDESGAFTVMLTASHSELTIYYNDAQATRPLRGCGERIIIRVTHSPHGGSSFTW